MKKTSNVNMIGAMIGDIAGSTWERKYLNGFNRKTYPKELITKESRFTDDTVLTYAIAKGMMVAFHQIRNQKLTKLEKEEVIKREMVRQVKWFAKKYPNAGYGGSFLRWVNSDLDEPYGSWGNGAAMRVSFPGWIAGSLQEAEWLAELSAGITHNHEFGLKAAKVVAGMIYLLRTGTGKGDVEQYAETYYDVSFTLDEIRPSYRFDVSCEGSVPQAIVAFLESKSYEDAIRLAISIGGDSDTIAAITGSLAEVHYKHVPEELLKKALKKLDSDMLDTVLEVSNYIDDNHVS